MFDVIELVEGTLQTMLNSGEVECPSADCDNLRFSVSIRRDEENGFVGDASCRDCELRIELDLDDEPIDRAETTLDEVRMTTPYSSRSVDRSEAEIVE